MGEVRRGHAAVIAAGLVAACRFGGPPGEATPTDGAPDAAPDSAADAGTDAANPVCDPMTLNLTLNGAELADFATDLPFAVGDSIRLNAGASCSPTGNINFTWILGDQQFVTRGSALDEFFIELYPDAVGDLSLQIQIDDGMGTVQMQAIPIVGVGFTALDVFDGNTGVISEMVIADGRLWLATDQGAFSQDVAMIDTVPYQDVNMTAGTVVDAVPNNVTDVAYDSDNNVVSFLPDARDKAYFFDRDADTITSYTPVNANATGALLDVQHLANGGVRLQTDKRTETSTDYLAFTAEWTQDRARVSTVQGNDVLAGGERLFRMVDADTSEEKEIFGTDDDDGIAAFFQDADGALWIGSDAGNADTGIGVIDNFDDATVTPHLLGETIHGIAQDAAGDMWVATANGVQRFKSDWGVWVPLGTKHGLATVDDRSVLVDEAGGRNRILVGTATDVFVLDRP